MTKIRLGFNRCVDEALISIKGFVRRFVRHDVLFSRDEPILSMLGKPKSVNKIRQQKILEITR